MSIRAKQWIIGLLGVTFLASLVVVQSMEAARRAAELGQGRHATVVPDDSRACVDCHRNTTPGILDHWEGSTHAAKGVGCYGCHKADAADADAFAHYGATIATIVTPRDCGTCHVDAAAEFARSRHSRGGEILASLDNFLAETVEGSRAPFDPHSPPRVPGHFGGQVQGMASAVSGCQQCHGGKVALLTTDGGRITSDDLAPGSDGRPTRRDVLERVARDASGKPRLDPASWPNTGIGRLNLDGSRGSCSACHSRHDFSPRRARQPENCGKCHLGPDHPQKEIYEESKHGVAFRDKAAEMKLDGETWVLGRDYAAAPTCATCHMSGHSRNGGRTTHDPGERISWWNRPAVSLPMDTDAKGEIVVEPDPAKRAALVKETAAAKRDRMKLVCGHCHTDDYVNAFYVQYDDLVVLYNEKFAKPGQAIMAELRARGLLTRTEFDEPIEWTWFYLWHHEGRRARHGASMMAPDYTHWHGMFEVAERFYNELVPQVRERVERARAEGKVAEADAVAGVLDGILRRPEHQWFGRGAGSGK